MKRDRQSPRERRGQRARGATRSPREQVLDRLARSAGPLSADTLAVELGLEAPAGRETLDANLAALVREGALVQNRLGEYGVAGRMDLVTGRVIGHPDGFGFLAPEGGGDDLFLPAWEMRRVLHGDRVVARVSGIDKRGRRQGALVDVLERANREVVGRYYREAGIGFVVPANSRISQELLVPPAADGGAGPGQIVVAEITEQPDQHRQPLARIREILGEHMAPGMEIDIALRVHEVPFSWPAAALEEVAEIPHAVRASDRRGRVDLREVPLVTIDGPDARDFDDAVYCEPAADGWRLLVAIADVAHYVRPGTALDAEAQVRGTSVYFPNRVLPMLPPELSNGICSLVPHEERLCMVCELDIDRRGGVRGSRFYDAVMRSAARLTYDEVAQAAIRRNREAREALGPITAHLDELYRLYGLLRKRRDARGAIDFDTLESKIEFDNDGKIARIVPTERNDAHRLIEECMIAANVAAAQTLAASGIGALYRVHQPPSAEKLEDLRTFLGELGLKLGGRKEPGPKEFARLLEEVGERPDRHLIQTVLLRSLRLAVYSPDPAGHFGLALEAYTHYTSPIRRYPDLMVHRALRSLRKRRGYPYDGTALKSLADSCSMTERRADEATRDVVAWLKCEHMVERVGEVFEGVVNAVTGFGMFVELREIYVEGLVHITALPNDYYHYDPIGHRLTGERSGRTFRLTDTVRVKVTRVDLDDRKIDFELVAEPGSPAPAPRGEEGRRRPRRGGRGRGRSGGGRR